MAFLPCWNHGTSLSLADSDGDGLSDLAELYQYETNPNLSDCDGDSIPLF
ncbi:MAG: hypothetical protein PHO37_07980 [Kiritimatiellae bacterium]|nr:hypothetical protein [Kiritimatiellia bacterium]